MVLFLLSHASLVPDGKDPAGKGTMLPVPVVSHSAPLKSDCPAELYRRGKGIAIFLLNETSTRGQRGYVADACGLDLIWKQGVCRCD